MAGKESGTSAALIATGPGRFVLGRVDTEPLRPDCVRVRTHLSGVSTGTDRWVSLGRFGWQDVPFPCIPGYQRVGTVEAVGSDVTTVAPGDRVAALTSVRTGGPAAVWGAHTALAQSPEPTVLPLGAGILDEQAALITTAQVGVNAAYRARLEPGDRVVVYGDGIIGACAALAALSRDCPVTLVGHHDRKLQLLESLGVRTLNNASASVSNEISEAAVVIDTVQNRAAQHEYVPLLPRGIGQIVYSGHSPDGADSWADMAQLQQCELTAHFVSGWTRKRLLQTLDLMESGRLPVERLVGWRAGAQEVVAVGERIAQSRLQDIATVIDWSEVAR